MKDSTNLVDPNYASRLDSIFLIQDGHTRTEVETVRQHLSTKYSLPYVPGGPVKRKRDPQKFPSLDRSKGLYVRNNDKKEFAEVDAEKNEHHWTQDARGSDIYNLETNHEQATGESFLPNGALNQQEFGKYYYRARQFPLYPKTTKPTPAMAMEDFLNRTISFSSGPRGRGNFRASKHVYQPFTTKTLHAPLLYVQSRHQHQHLKRSKSYAAAARQAATLYDPSGSTMRNKSMMSSTLMSPNLSLMSNDVTSVMVDGTPMPDVLFLGEQSTASKNTSQVQLPGLSTDTSAGGPAAHQQSTTTRGRSTTSVKLNSEQDKSLEKHSILDDPSPVHRQKMKDVENTNEPSGLALDRQMAAMNATSTASVHTSSHVGGGSTSKAKKSSSKLSVGGKNSNGNNKSSKRASVVATDEKNPPEPDGVIGRNYNLMSLEDVARVPVRNDSMYRMVWRLTTKANPVFFNVMPHREGVITPGEQFELRVKQNPNVKVPKGVYVFKLAMGDPEQVWLVQMFACVVPARDDIREVTLKNGQTYELLSKYGPPKQMVQWRAKAHEYVLNWHADVNHEKLVLPPINTEANPLQQQKDDFMLKNVTSSTQPPKSAKSVASTAGGVSVASTTSKQKPGSRLGTTESTRIGIEQTAETHTLVLDEDEEEDKKTKLPPVKKEIELVRKKFPLAGLAEAEAAQEAAERGVSADNKVASGVMLPAIVAVGPPTGGDVQGGKKKNGGKHVQVASSASQSTITSSFSHSKTTGSGRTRSTSMASTSHKPWMHPPAVDYTQREGEQLLYSRRSYSFARLLQKPPAPKKNKSELEVEVKKIAKWKPPVKRALNKPKTPPKTEFDKLGDTLQRYAEHYNRLWNKTATGSMMTSHSQMGVEVARGVQESIQE
ncbi:unnamed protein product [Amoebophrya sp. A120]|nr:unnamed protein product [Amoebophrya sp. A120]|eukprot:GSA120T00000004001.1